MPELPAFLFLITFNFLRCSNKAAMKITDKLAITSFAGALSYLIIFYSWLTDFRRTDRKELQSSPFSRSVNARFKRIRNGWNVLLIFKKNSELPKIHRINKDVNPDSDWNGARKKRLFGTNL
jgi:hypothetical protein